MCLIKGAFVGEKNFDVIKMHGTIQNFSTPLYFVLLVVNICVVRISSRAVFPSLIICSFAIGGVSVGLGKCGTFPDDMRGLGVLPCENF